jgi:hypothetical protein
MAAAVNNRPLVDSKDALHRAGTRSAPGARCTATVAKCA